MPFYLSLAPQNIEQTASYFGSSHLVFFGLFFFLNFFFFLAAIGCFVGICLHINAFFQACAC